MKISVSPRREHDFSGLEASKINGKSQTNQSKIQAEKRPGTESKKYQFGAGFGRGFGRVWEGLEDIKLCSKKASK